MAFIYDLTDTWNAGGTTFNAIKMNVTDTASAAASKLITVQVSGSEKFSVKKDGVGYFSGNVGIGTTSPAAKLDVDGGDIYVRTSGRVLTDTVQGYTGLSTPLALSAAQTVTISTASSERMRIDSSGNVGIGTSSPGAKLDVSGDISVSGNENYLNLWSSAVVGNNIRARIRAVGAGGGSGFGGDFRVSTRAPNNAWNTDAFVVNSSGNVGIGTSSPGAKLHVVGNTFVQSGTIFTDAITSYGGTSLSLNGGSNLISITGGSERMRIDSSGKVGIGTTSPNYLLDVEGVDPLFRINATSGNALAQLSVADTTSICGLNFGDSGSASSGQIYYRHNGDSMAFNTAATERMRITSAGLVGIGTSSPGNLLEVAGATPIVEINSTSGSPELQFSDGGVDEFSIQYDTGGKSLKFVEGGVGTHVTIKDGGNVGIGTGSPDARLRVSGNTNSLQARFANVDGRGLAISTLSSAGTNDNGVIYNAGVFADAQHVWQCGGTERMRIDSSGNLLVGLTSGGEAGIIRASGSNAYGATVTANGGSAFNVNYTGTGTGYFGYYKYGGTLVGSISSTGTTTSYNTSSDARLKDNIADAEDAANLIDAIQVRKFDWKADGSHQRYGMVAQELLEVAPEAVSGEPEGEDMMGVDYSKLVPMLIKEIQSLRARVAQLEG